MDGLRFTCKKGAIMSLLEPIYGGRMYDGWHRWNPIGGCLHNCFYCYMKPMSKRCGVDMTTPTGLRKEYLNDNLGTGRKIFVCSSGDMWGEWVKSDDIQKVLEHCRKYPDNEYMFLTKNPRRYNPFLKAGGEFPAQSIFGVTIETDLERLAKPLKAQMTPTVINRLNWTEKIREDFWSKVKLMISIEPVIKFSKDFYNRIFDAGPDIVYIGRDTGHNNLPEPTDDELRWLVTELREAGMTVHLKKSLDGLMEG